MGQKTEPTGRWTTTVVMPIHPSVSWDSFRGLQTKIMGDIGRAGGHVENLTKPDVSHQFGKDFRMMKFRVRTPKSSDWDQVNVMGWITCQLRAAVHGYSSRMDTGAWVSLEEIEKVYGSAGDGTIPVSFWMGLQVGELPEFTDTDEDERMMDE